MTVTYYCTEHPPKTRISVPGILQYLQICIVSESCVVLILAMYVLFLPCPPHMPRFGGHPVCPLKKKRRGKKAKRDGEPELPARAGQAQDEGAAAAADAAGGPGGSDDGGACVRAPALCVCLSTYMLFLFGNEIYLERELRADLVRTVLQGVSTISGYAGFYVC